MRQVNTGKEIAISPRAKLIDFLGVAAAVIRAEKNSQAKNHMIYQTHQFISDRFSDFNAPEGEGGFPGGHITLSQEAVDKAGGFIKGSDLDSNKPKIFFNPDASCRFTRIPLDIQVALLKRLANLPIDIYAALIDRCDIFIAGDAGPLHVAAARKYSRLKGREFRNRTAIFSVFGATPQRIYGYDSRLPGFFHANQDAPSHVYIAPSSCRNMLCIAKKFITCDPGCFFGSLDIEEIISGIRSYLNLHAARKQSVGSI